MSKYVVKTAPAPVVKEDDSALGSFDVVEQLDKARLILQRELRNLAVTSARGKLSPTESRDLVAYIKLLSELESAEKDALANMKDDDLKNLASKKLDNPD